MKHIIHTPTGDFAYAQTEFEDLADRESALEEHRNLVASIKEQGIGLDNKTFIALLDELWEKESINGDHGIIEQMSKSQQEIVRAFKLVIKRAKR